MSDWQETTLGDVLTLQRGFDLPARDRVDGPYPIVSSSGVTGHHAVAKVQPPGVVIGRYGSLGSVHWITEPYWPHNTALWVKDFKGNDPRFVSYLLQTISHDGSAAAAVPGVNRNHLHRLPVRVPGPDVQRRIGAILAAFDELIAINERRIELLEDFARSLYREWFVRQRLSRQAGGDDSVDWLDYCLGDLAEVVTDGINPDQVAPDVPYCGLEHLPRRATTLREWGGIESVTSRKLRFKVGDTLFGKIRPYFHKVVWSPFDGVASSDAIVFRATGESRRPALVATILSSDAVVAEAVATSNGTKMPRADPTAILNLRFALPALNSDVVQHAEDTLRSTYDLASELAAENRRLSTTRDLLLPRLVTGQLDISDVDLGDLLTEAA